MGLVELYNKLNEYSIPVELEDDESRIRLQGQDGFDEFISTSKSGKLKIEIYLTKRKESLTREDFKKYLQRRSELGDSLNQLDLGVKFDQFGVEA